MIKKLVGVTLLVAVIGLLAYGAFNRTSESLVSADGISEEYGQGNGLRNGSGNVLGEDRRETWDGTQHEDGVGYGEGEPLIETLPLGELTRAETDALLFMREEEKLARDVYTVFAEQWDLPMFANIAESEQTHMDSILELLDRYEVADPASSEAGVFTNPELQVLYDQLVVTGSKSLADAIKVGGAIEEIDILDLRKRLAQTDQEDITLVFENLLRGSYNHLNAFASIYAVQAGEEYQPQYMTLEDFQVAIAEGGAGGFGGGRGQGNGGQGGGRR